MSYDLGGFSVTASTSRVMLIIFAVYSVVIVGFGFYIKYQSKKGGKDGLASLSDGRRRAGSLCHRHDRRYKFHGRRHHGGRARPWVFRWIHSCIGLLRRFPDCCLWPGQRGAQSGDPA